MKIQGLETRKTLTFQGSGLTMGIKIDEVCAPVADGSRKEAVADGKTNRRVNDNE